MNFNFIFIRQNRAFQMHNLLNHIYANSGMIDIQLEMSQSIYSLKFYQTEKMLNNRSSF